jgi:hypothetical protein
MTYASVVSSESVKIALTLVALNALDGMMGDIKMSIQLPQSQREFGLCLVLNLVTTLVSKPSL